MTNRDQASHSIKQLKRRLELLQVRKATEGMSVDPSVIIEIEKLEVDIHELEGGPFGERDRVSTKCVLFLGAGASEFSGYRTYQSFPDLMFNTQARSNEGLNSVDTRTLMLLENIQKVLNIEHRPRTHDNFMWILNSYVNLLRDLRVDNELKSRFVSTTISDSDFSVFDGIVTNAIKEMITTTIRHFSRNRVELAKNNPELYQRMRDVYELYTNLAKLNSSVSPLLSIFTTNYDMLLEDMCSEFSGNSLSNVPLITGCFNYVKDGVPWDYQLYETDDAQRSGMHLYRIHGCACWYWEDYGNPNIYFYRDPPPDRDELKTICAMFPGREIYRGRNPHAYSFHKFYKAVLDCETLIFVGFSFRDEDVMQIILSANAQRSAPLQIVTIDPNFSEAMIRKSLSDAADRCTFPVRVPEIKELMNISLAFGESHESNKKIFDSLNKFILGENND